MFCYGEILRRLRAINDQLLDEDKEGSAALEEDMQDL